MGKKEALGEWFDTLWGTDDCKVYLAYKEPTSPLSFSVPKAQPWPSNRNNIIEYVLAMSARGNEVYYAPSEFILDTVSKHKYVQIPDPQNTGKTIDSEVPNVLGSRVLYLDFDGNAADAVQKLGAATLCPRPTARVQSSKIGHEHWYWVLDKRYSMEEFENVNRKLAYFFNADTGCWDAGRVLRPPFTTNYKPEHGEPLAIDFLELDYDKVSSLDAFDFLPAVKESLIDNLEELGSIPPIEEVLAKYRWDQYHLALFRKEQPTDPKTGKVERSSALVRLAYFGAENGMPDEAIYAIIENADSRWGKFVGRADRQRRLVQIIQKVRVKHPFKAPIETVDEDPVQLVYTFNELLHSEFELEWLVKDLIPKGTTCFLSAESGIGKSRLSLQLALAMASGTQFMKWPITEKYKTFYLSLEMGGDELKEFIGMLSAHKDLEDDVSENFKLAPIGDPLVIDSDEGFNLLEMIIKEHRPDIMFIDALGKLTLDSLEQVVAKNINNRLNVLKKKYGVTFMIIHHMRKPAKGDKTAPGKAEIYGDQYIITDAALVLGLFMPDTPDHIELIKLKSRFTMSDEPVVMDGKSGFKFVMKEKGGFGNAEYTDQDFGL